MDADEQPSLHPALNVWRYAIETGIMDNGLGQVFHGYAGRGLHINDPMSVGDRDWGPLPTGTYKILPPRAHPRLGPLALALAPIPGTEMLGRSGFYIHGDNMKGNRSASHGCIILNRLARSAIASGLGHRSFLVVVPR